MNYFLFDIARKEPLKREDGNVMTIRHRSLADSLAERLNARLGCVRYDVRPVDHSTQTFALGAL